MRFLKLPIRLSLLSGEFWPAPRSCKGARGWWPCTLFTLPLQFLGRLPLPFGMRLPRLPLGESLLKPGHALLDLLPPLQPAIKVRHALFHAPEQIGRKRGLGA